MNTSINETSQWSIFGDLATSTANGFCAVVFSLLAGSGHVTPIQFPVATGGMAYSEIASTPQPPTMATVADIVAEIRTAFGLPISQLAQVLGVSRPTVYAWLGDEQQPHQRNWDKLRQIQSVAKYWNDLADLPIPEKWLRSPSANGAGILDMLAADTIDASQVEQRLLEAADRLKERKPSWLEDARKRGFNLSDRGPDSPEFDVLTRRPMDER